MKQVDFNDDDRRWAKIQAQKIPKLENSILDGKGKDAGMLGELAGLRVFGGKLDGNYFDWDLTLPESWTACGRHADVKTKQCSGPPLPHYMCHVTKANDDQACDLYIFVRVNYAKTHAWVCGWMTKGEFIAKRVLCIEGDPDPNSARHFPWKADCWGVPISACHQVEDPEIPLGQNAEKYMERVSRQIAEAKAAEHQQELL